MHLSHRIQELNDREVYIEEYMDPLLPNILLGSHRVDDTTKMTFRSDEY